MSARLVRTSSAAALVTIGGVIAEGHAQQAARAAPVRLVKALTVSRLTLGKDSTLAKDGRRFLLLVVASSSPAAFDHTQVSYGGADGADPISLTFASTSGAGSLETSDVLLVGDATPYKPIGAASRRMALFRPFGDKPHVLELIEKLVADDEKPLGFGEIALVFDVPVNHRPLSLKVGDATVLPVAP